MATVRLFRPDLFINEIDPQQGQAIPNEMPPHFLDKHIPHIEGIGEPTTATFFTHSKIDPTNWFHPPLPFSLSSLISPLFLFSVEYQVDVGEI
jgi:hypothetical protein